eukprot:1818639-Pyramimonas_sp.AAC.1
MGVDSWWWALWAGRSKLEVGQVGLKLAGGGIGIGMSKLDAGRVGLRVDRLRSKAGGGVVEVDSW